MKIRLYQQGDEKKLIPLFERVFERPMGRTESELHFRWKFGQAGSFMWLAEEEGDIIAQYAFVPRRFWLAGKEIPAVLGVDSMTHPAHRGKGLFLTLGRQSYPQLAERGIELVYGFPNAQVRKMRFEKLDWFPVGQLPVWFRPLNTRRLAQTVGVPAPLSILAGIGGWLYELGLKISTPISSLKTREVNSFDDRFDNFWAACRSHFPISLIRDKQYLEWRYVNKPDDRHKILIIEDGKDLLGYAVIKGMEKRNLNLGFIMELMALPDRIDAFDSLMRSILESFREMGVDAATTLLTTCHPYFKRHLRYGFIPIPEKFFPYQISFGARIVNTTHPASFLSQQKNWLISWGDSDVV